MDSVMLMWFDSIFALIRQRRVCWFEGTFGSYKTALSMRIAFELVSRGFAKHIVSNVPCVWSEDIKSINFDAERATNTVIILDEAGLFLESIRDVRPFTAGMRKLNNYLLIPSIENPNRKVCNLRVSRVFDGGIFGLPLVAFGYRLSESQNKDMGFFAWWQPAEIFGIYDTKDLPIDDCGISDVLIDWIQKYTGKGASQLGARARIEILDHGGGAVNQLEEIQDKIDQFVSVLDNSQFDKKTGKGKV